MLCKQGLRLRALGRTDEALARVREAKALEPHGGDEATGTIDSYLHSWGGE